MVENWSATHTVEQAAFVRVEMLKFRLLAIEAGLQDKITPARAKTQQAYRRCSSDGVASIRKKSRRRKAR